MFFDVWIIFTRGKQSNDEHWLMIENVADITAWLPTIDASVAMTSTGQNTGSAQFHKQYLFIKQIRIHGWEYYFKDVYLELIYKSSIQWHLGSLKGMRPPQCRKASGKDRHQT